MFPRTYFAGRVFAPRYFPQSSAAPVGAGGGVRATAGGSSRAAAAPGGEPRVRATATGAARVSAAPNVISGGG